MGEAIGGGRRIYHSPSQKHIIKIARITGDREVGRNNSIEEEYRLLQKAYPIGPQPLARSSKAEYQWLCYEKVEGTLLRDWTGTTIQRLLLIGRMGAVLIRLSFRNIVHNDLTASNIVILPNQRIRLIDFDQACQLGYISSLFYNFSGLPLGKNRLRTGYPKMIAQLFKPILPSRFRKFLERKIGELDARRLPILHHDASESLELVHQAWKRAQRSSANAPGKRICYYSMEFDGFIFPGERPWSERWAVLRNIRPLAGARILELGCNLALLSTYALSMERAAGALCVDSDTDILGAAELAARAHGVKPRFLRGKMEETSRWGDEARNFKPDIVFALSVLNWVKDKESFLSFLSEFPEVIFEGHDSIEVESDRFMTAGFTKIDFVGTSERNRPILYCRKE